MILSFGLFQNDTTYFGAIVGRVANRIGGAKFVLNGVTYKTDANDGKNTLHGNFLLLFSFFFLTKIEIVGYILTFFKFLILGGSKGFSDVIWTVKSYRKHSHVTFSYESFDGEEGIFTLNCKIVVKNIKKNSLKLCRFSRKSFSFSDIHVASEEQTSCENDGQATKQTHPSEFSLTHLLEPRWPQQWQHHVSHT